MSNETIKKVGEMSSSKSDCSLGAQFIPKSTPKTPISVLSPHVAEFVPKSLALKRESPSAKSAKCLEEKSAQREDLNDVPTVEGLSREHGDGVECSSRGWWDGAPLNIKIDKTSTRNLPKPSHTMRGFTERSHRQPREYRTGYSWRQNKSRAEMDANWRLRPSDSDHKETKNEFHVRDEKKTIEKDFCYGDVHQNKEARSLPSSFGGKSCRNETRSGKDKLEQVSQVMDGGQQRQQGSVRIGESRGRGRGRGRTAWMNDTQNQNISAHNNESKDLRISNQNNVKRIGRGHGFGRNTFSHVEGAVPKKTSHSGNISFDLTRKEKEKDVNSIADDDGWIVVGNKKKTDEQKDNGKQMKEKMRIENQLSTKSKEMNGKDDKMTVLDSQQKLEKWKRKMDQKKERKMEHERKTVENKETSSEIIIAPNVLGRQGKHYQGKSKALLKTEKDSDGIMESRSKIDKNMKEKESKKVEILKVIKTEKNPNQKEVKILLKRNDSKVLHEEQTVLEDPGFDLHEDENEFPDLAASSKAGGTSLASDWLSGGSRMPIISYSAVLKAMPKPKTQLSRNLPNEKGSSTTQEHDENEGQKKKKRKKKKKAKDNDDKTKQAPQEPKKAKQPMQFDLGDWLSTMKKSPSKITKEKQTNSKKPVTIATGVLQIKVKDQPSATSRATTAKATHGLLTTDKTFHNILDSTAPVVKRGKEREVPKKKKPSQMKRIILKEREEKRKAFEGEEKQDEKCEAQSLVEEHDHSSEETSDEQKFEGKPSNEDTTIPAVNQSQDTFITHHHGDTIATPTDLGSDGDQNVAPSEDDIKARIHSRRFREYCDNVMDKELNNTTLQLLQKLVIFQDRQYHKDPVKSKAKRRFVVGLREVTKHLKLKKIKLVIVSPNVERIKSAGGLDDTLHNIISIAHQNGVPVVFALRRQVLGRVLHKKVPVSAIGVFYHDGAEDEYKKLMDLTEKARDIYAQRWKAAYDELVERIHKERAEEMSHDIQDDTSSSHDQCGEVLSSEIPNEIKKEQDKVSEDVDKDSNIREMRKMGEHEKYECNRNEGNEWEKEKEMKDELLKQKEKSSDESEDEDKLETENSGNEKVELHETNEIENEWDNNHSVPIQRDLTVEEL